MPEEIAEKEIAALRLEIDQLKLELEAASAAESAISLHSKALW